MLSATLPPTTTGSARLPGTRGWACGTEQPRRILLCRRNCRRFSSFLGRSIGWHLSSVLHRLSNKADKLPCALKLLIFWAQAFQFEAEHLAGSRGRLVTERPTRWTSDN